MVGCSTNASHEEKGKAMAKEYKQLSLKERKEIENGLDRGDSIREIARLIDRSASSVSREVRQNRIIQAHKAKKGSCKDANWCKRSGICAEECLYPGARCAGCDKVDCKNICPEYAIQSSCSILARSPWVCNPCHKRRYGCNRANRYIYDAKLADGLSSTRRSDSRRGIDMDQNRAQIALAQIKEGLSRGLSPYELSVLYEDTIGVHRSTIYRWVEAGYGNLTNLELERKVGFKQRTHRIAKTTSHSRWRSHAAFEKLAESIKASTTEMDTVVGRSADKQAVLTLYSRASHLQLALLLSEKSPAEVVRVLKVLKKICPKKIFDDLFYCVLTDNGEEFVDERGLGKIFGEGANPKAHPHLYYCDIRASQQKGSCEKNHSELRQILQKGQFVFDDLDIWDLSVVMSHANSNPRNALCGLSPIQMFCAAYGKDGQDFLGQMGIEQMERGEIVLKPSVLDTERAKRGREPVKRVEKRS